MLNHQMDCKVYDAFPAIQYGLSLKEIEQIRLAVKTEKEFDQRFFKKAESINLTINAKRIHESEIQAVTLEHLTKIIVWKIETQIP